MNQQRKRTIAIGDIHGCSAALHAILEAIDPGPEDTIVTLGDYVNRGPDSKGVLEQLIKLAGRCHYVPLMGNHEEMLLGALDSRSGLDFLLKFGGRETLDSYGKPGRLDLIPRSHIRFIESCRRYHETESHIFVHAGIWPNRPMPEQTTSMLFWEDLDPERVGQHYSGKVVVVGHTPQKTGRILDLGFLKCIDTGCGIGGHLTALDVHNGRIWQVDDRGESRVRTSP